MDMETLKNRLCYALKSMAICDAVGYEFEFKSFVSKDAVRKHAFDGSRKLISDDTQMTLFMIEQFSKLDPHPTDRAIFNALVLAYTDWYRTQTEEYVPGKYEGLLDRKDLYALRAPGMTCMASCKSLMNNRIPTNDSSGCGAVMRALGVLFLTTKLTTIDDLLRASVVSVILTHTHEEALGAIESYITYSLAMLNSNALQNRHESRFTSAKSIDEFGEGWTSMSCLNMALYSVINGADFTDMMTTSIAHGGDSDSVAAVAGSMWPLLGSRSIEDLKTIDYLYETLVEKDTIDMVLNMIRTTRTV